MEQIGYLNDLATILNAKFETRNLNETTSQVEAHAETCQN
jgi:hypothetical protein